MPGVEWWYMDVMGDKQGPVTLQHLKDLYKKEKIFLGTQIWGTGQGEWKKLWEMPTIRKIVAGKRDEITYVPHEKSKPAQHFRIPDEKMCDEVFKRLKLDKKDVKTIVQFCFKEIDQDQSGTLEISEVKSSLVAFCKHLSTKGAVVCIPSDDDIRMLVYSLDKDGNGTLEISEMDRLAKGLAARYYIQTRDNLKDMKEEFIKLSNGLSPA
mmetsp:Transcript_19287/g.30657  ORF Transcript_19287/g.30657 Transcript_19287/m.30657 type:complete len:210 (+) Transcript_19287:104-733(+)